MVNIAFKRAKASANLQGVMHPDFITEYADVTQFPEGFHKVEDGYEILSKDLFDLELAKNEQLQEQFLKDKKEMDEYKAKLVEDKRRREELQAKLKARRG